MRNSLKKFGDYGYFQVNPGATFEVKDNFINSSTLNTSWNTTAATLKFIVGGDGRHDLYLPGDR